MRAKGSKKTETKATKKDNVFTRPEMASEYMDRIVKRFPEFIVPSMHAIEPSAGSGAFLNALTSYFSSVDAFDIEPKHTSVIKQDFLTWEMAVARDRSSVICCGNPPFSITKKFLQKCATISDHIVMILPQRYYQNIPINTLDKQWKVEYAELLPVKGDGAPFEGKEGVAAALMYLRRVIDYVRPVRKKAKSEGFVIKTYHGTESIEKSVDKPDLVFWQAGPKAGKRARVDEIGNGMTYGLHFVDKAKLAKLEDMEVETIMGTNGFRYINMEQICKTFNKI